MNEKIYSADGTKVKRVIETQGRNFPYILSSVGLLGGLYYAFNQKSGFWGYLGYGLLGSVAGSVTGNVIRIIAFPKMNEVEVETKIQAEGGYVRKGKPHLGGDVKHN